MRILIVFRAMTFANLGQDYPDVSRVIQVGAASISQKSRAVVVGSSLV